MGGIGWILMTVVGGVAGLIASRMTKTNHSLTGNVILGILGAVGMNAVLASILGIHLEGVLGQLIAASIGAAAIIGLFQVIKKNQT